MLPSQTCRVLAPRPTCGNSHLFLREVKRLAPAHWAAKGEQDSNPDLPDSKVRAYPHRITIELSRKGFAKRSRNRMELSNVPDAVIPRRTRSLGFIVNFKEQFSPCSDEYLFIYLAPLC